MTNIEASIVPLVKNQFPDFFKEEGPLFVMFAEEYFKWLSENNNTLFESRNLPNTRDIDQTADEFLIHFKEKYLNGIEFNSTVDMRKLVKAASSLFKSKSTERSIDLLFKLVYGAKVEIYRPGLDVLKPSDGTWVIPKYLELTRSAKTVNMVGKQISGSQSGATAFVEYLITRNVKGKIIDVLFLSNILGNFVRGDIITTDGIVDGAPKVSGSLSDIFITNSGKSFSVGEIVDITSSRGIEGKARITGLYSETGIVSFEIIDGGWGYSITANTTVSEKVLLLSNITNTNTEITDFTKYELLSQNVHIIGINNTTGNFSVGSVLTNVDGAEAIIVKVQQTADANTANLYTVSYLDNIFSNTAVYLKDREYIVTNNSVVFSIGEVVKQENAGANNSTGAVLSSSNAVVMYIDTATISSNGLHVGQFVEQDVTGATGVIKLIPRENNYTHSNVSRIAITTTNGLFSNTDKIQLFDNSDKDTYLANATPTYAGNGYIYVINSIEGSRWSTSNNIILATSPATNTTIQLAADVGGKKSSNTSVLATGVVIGSNSTSVGLVSVSNTFYSTTDTTTIVYGGYSNTFANIVSISTGTGADFSIGAISDAETVLLSPDHISSNNDGLGYASVKFSDMLVSGANSTYGNVSSVCVFAGGSGYSNTDKVQFIGGNTGVGSRQCGNATIVTDNSGSIVTVQLSANTGNSITTTPTVSIVTSSGTGANLVPFFAYGFVKSPTGDAQYYILDLLRFERKTIGTIASLTGINPGENYNIKPYVNILEQTVSAYGKKDIIIEVNDITGGPTFITGETLAQVTTIDSVVFTSNTYSGNTSYEVGEKVYFYNSSTYAGEGTVYSESYDIGSNNFTTVVIDITGSYNTDYNMIGNISNCHTIIRSSEISTASATAKGVVERVANNTVYIKRRSLFTDFVVGERVAGDTSSVTANVVSVSENDANRVAGDNANILADVISSNGSIQSISVVSSGLGYEQDEAVNITSADGERVARGKAQVNKQGTGEGYYSSTRGFLDNNKFLFDGDYYQNYSYEVQSSIPFEKYSDILKNVLHVAGTKAFGRVNILSTVSSNVSINSTIQINT